MVGSGRSLPVDLTVPKVVVTRNVSRDGSGDFPVRGHTRLAA